jgi:Putative Flp pilus-assembly TadE/G-like
MLPALIRRPRRNVEYGSRQRGFTMAFVAIAMVAIVSMAALAIDIGTLYEAKAEAQRAADAAALAAAQVISTSGITGDPTNADLSWKAACGGSASLASLAANSVAKQNLIGGNAPSTINVYYGISSGVGTITDCTSLGTAFGVNPVVEVSVQQASLPTFFARVFSLISGGTSSNSGVSATAAAEAFNPSGSSPMIPVQPRCVKPWMVPNLDPGPKGTCTGGACPHFVDPTSGAILNGGVPPNGVIGETFNLVADCQPGHRRSCHLNTPQPVVTPAGTLQYVPAQTSNASVAIAANSTITGCSKAAEDTNYWNAVAGCDQTTKYACGSSLANTVDLTADNPGRPGNDSVYAAQCLINATDANASSPITNGQDYLDPAAKPYTYPFQIKAGSNSALTAAGIAKNSQITSSPSIVSLPIYDNGTPLTASTTPVTVVGFLQVFINSVDSANPGNINVTVMNIAGCGNGSTPPPVALGTSPVPVRLISIP